MELNNIVVSGLAKKSNPDSIGLIIFNPKKAHKSLLE